MPAICIEAVKMTATEFRRISIVFAAMSLASVVPAQVAAQPASGSTAQAVTEADAIVMVEAAMQRWADAYNSHDPQRVAARYHSEAAFWGTTSPTLRTTPEDIAMYFAGLRRRPDARVTIGPAHIRIAGAVAVVTGAYTFTDRVDGAAVVRPSRFSFVLERSGADWLIVQHHSSRMPE